MSCRPRPVGLALYAVLSPVLSAPAPPAPSIPYIRSNKAAPPAHNIRSIIYAAIPYREILYAGIPCTGILYAGTSYAAISLPILLIRSIPTGHTQSTQEQSARGDNDRGAHVRLKSGTWGSRYNSIIRRNLKRPRFWLLSKKLDRPALVRKRLRRHKRRKRGANSSGVKFRSTFYWMYLYTIYSAEESNCAQHTYGAPHYG